jgi:putative oxidoreductase
MRIQRGGMAITRRRASAAERAAMGRSAPIPLPIHPRSIRNPMPSPTAWLERHSALGVPLFRLFLGATLVYGTQDNVFSRERMLEFSEFLATNGFPAPLFNAHLSAWAQFICGVLIAVGAATRPAAAVMVINFAVALWMVHRNLPFNANIAPLAMFFGSLLLVFHGAGAYSVDAAMQRRAGSTLHPRLSVE